MSALQAQPCSPAYAYGQLLGTIHRGLQQFAADLNAGFAAGSRPRLQVDRDKLREVLAEEAYRKGIARQRRLAVAEAQRIVLDLGPELGLPRLQPTRSSR